MSASSCRLSRVASQGLSQASRSRHGGNCFSAAAFEARSAVGSSSASPSASTSRSFVSSVAKGTGAPRLHLAPLAAKDPLLFDALRPRPESAFVALAHRLRLITPKTDERTKKLRVEALIQACTHPSFAQLVNNTVREHGINADVGTGKGLRRNLGEEEENEGDEGLAGYSTMEEKYRAVQPGTAYGSSEEAGVSNSLEEEQGMTENVSLSLKATHTFFDEQYLDAKPGATNEALSHLGNSILGLIASEHLHLKYPNLPTRVLQAAVSAYVGPNTLADVAAELGIAAKGIVRWDRYGTKSDEGVPKGKPLLAKRQKEKLLSRDVHAEALRGVVGIILQHQGLSATRSFVETHFLSRMIPLLDLLKFNNPKRTLSDLCKKVGRERPQSRMVAETGRSTINPIFVVGVYSGTEKLGEGTGSGIRMAEYRAAEDALRRFYLSERPLEEISLPSTTLDEELAANSLEDAVDGGGRRTVWNIDAMREEAAPFQASEIGHSEVVFGSKR